MAEDYIFKQTSFDLNSNQELRDQLSRADNLMQKLKSLQTYQIYDPLASSQGGILLKAEQLQDLFKRRMMQQTGMFLIERIRNWI